MMYNSIVVNLFVVPIFIKDVYIYICEMYHELYLFYEKFILKKLLIISK